MNRTIPVSPWKFLLHALTFNKYIYMVGFCAVAEMSITLAKLSLSYVIGDIIAIAEQNKTLSWSLFYNPIVWVVSLSVVIAIVIFADSQSWRYFTVPVQANIIKRLFSSVQSHPYLFFVNSHTGRIAQKITDVAHSALLAVDGILYGVLHVASSIVIGVILLLFENPILGLLSLIWLLIFLTFCTVTGIKCGQYAQAVSMHRGIASGGIVDSITNIFNVRIFSQEEQEKYILQNRLDDYSDSGVELFRYQRNMLFQGALLSGVFLIGSVLYILNSLILAKINLAETSVQLTLLILMVKGIENLPFQIRALMGQIGNIREGLDFLFGSQESREIEDKPDLEVTSGDIQFDNISFQYENTQTIFQNLNLSILENQKVGLIGASGAGKSTLCNMLLQFYEINGGAIFLDGKDIEQYSKSSVREAIAVIPQDTSLFHRSLMENIRYGRADAGDDEVIEAAKKAHADEFITELPQGYETLVGERGVKLSGGQRQRIAIARAILKDAPILILDEATSALDSESEQLIQESLKELMQGKTVIAIAHRLSTIAHLDRLIVMDQGQIIEDGAHEELLKQGGTYAKLWNMQSGGFLGE